MFSPMTELALKRSLTSLDLDNQNLRVDTINLQMVRVQELLYLGLTRHWECHQPQINLRHSQISTQIKSIKFKDFKIRLSSV